jgi:hypothetical protein
MQLAGWGALALQESSMFRPRYSDTIASTARVVCRPHSVHPRPRHMTNERREHVRTPNAPVVVVVWCVAAPPHRVPCGPCTSIAQDARRAPSPLAPSPSGRVSQPRTHVTRRQHDDSTCTPHVDYSPPPARRVWRVSHARPYSNRRQRRRRHSCSRPHPPPHSPRQQHRSRNYSQQISER